MLCEGGTGIFGFAVLAVFWIGFSVFVPKNFGFSVSLFIAVCGFSPFSIWFSVFAKNANGFSDLISDAVFGFSS